MFSNNPGLILELLNKIFILIMFYNQETGLEKINDYLKIDETNATLKNISESLINNCRTYLNVAKIAHKPMIELEQKQLQLCIKQIVRLILSRNRKN